ncbi:hypothetical protein N7495_006265 [Penicillium taxi]|uniref:uncharacterized protein n=1 Tax=Penicillium taxi TaxID=168475 RepID=UPI0025458C7F|nr:uncharacterized protein N7495_006265 [Penicillium taxi]KAJ5894574.1 hypothetical protein N7495_006265 [Penicillium taxi]
MVDQKELEDHPSPTSVITVRIPLQPNPPCDQSHEDPTTVPLPPSPVSPLATPPPILFSPAHEADPNVGPEPELGELGEFGGSGRSSPMFMANLLEFDSLRATTAPTMPVSKDVDVAPQVFFEDFAIRYRQSQRKQAQRKRLEKRLRAIKVSIGVSARLIRIGSTVQRGLVEALKQDDKANFAALYHMLYDLQESCSSISECDNHDELESSHEMNHSSDFFHQLSPQSRSDLLDILRLVRSDPQFLVDRLRSLTPSQLATLTAPATTLDPGDPAFPSSSSSSRPRGQYPFNRTYVQTASFKDHAYAFERTDPLSILLCNVYAAPMEPESPEARLQMETWSSVCAQLMSHGSSRFYPLIGQILSSWAAGSNWKARPKFELYLMDILQTGAFLLEPIDAPAGLDFSTSTLDPLRTEVAEEFFASAVDDLFRVLDDPDGGFPCTVLKFAKAVLGKLNNPESRSRFIEYLFLQWFFPKFLYSALTYPETFGLLLDFYICKDARDKLLNQVGLRAYSQVFAVLRSMPNFSILRLSVRERVENMLSRFNTASADPTAPDPSAPLSDCPNHRNSSKFLLLSSTDMLTIIDALYPTCYSSHHTSPSSVGIHSWSFNIPRPYSPRLEPFTEPNVVRSNHNTSPRPTSQNGSILSMESLSGSASVPEPGPGQIASRIRFELTDLDDLNERPKLEHPSDEHWAIFSISKDGRGLTWSLLPDWEAGSAEVSGIESDDDTQSTTLGLEDNHEALQTAIVRLIKEDHVYYYDDYDRLSSSAQRDPMSLKNRFYRAMAAAHNSFDFVGEHYWWNSSQQLRHGRAGESSPVAPDSWILQPMHDSSVRSLDKSRAVIERCEQDSVSLDQSLRRLQSQIKELMATVSKVRNKMWYMTDVKNSNRYEEARHVAMALKTMIYSPRSSAAMPDESRSRSGPRSLGGSLFQKPELQVMNMMRAPNSQGGPKKLSDEQVELTRKWLSHNAIENFCKGEERIHRFCYEVRASITRLVGETMAETPVLWASELFQKERTRYEGYGARTFPGIPMATTPRSSTTTSEDPLHSSHIHSPGSSIPESLSRFSQDIPSLEHKPSIQSLMSDSWRLQREVPSIDVSSVGGSPTRAASTSTGDTYSTFWSAPFRHQMYAASVSSAYSRPPSMFSDTGARHLRRSDRKTQGKTAFIDSLKQTLTSLLLSDLGSPVWSCGSETDAWFANTIDQNRIRMEMQRRAAVQNFYSRYDERAKHLREQRRPTGARRSRSLDTPSLRTRKNQDNGASYNSEEESSTKDDRPEFSYKTVFYRLIEVFSRHGNPFVKLDALRDLRSLVVASLISGPDASSSNMAGVRPVSPETDRVRDNCPRSRTSATRHSFSARCATTNSQIGTAPATAPEFSARTSHRSEPSDEQIVTALRELILDVKPKTLFRDLQFISAFVPADQLNNTDHGTAFLQFGLAALSLKDEVCHSMVEIADRIVSREFMRRHPPESEFYPRPSHAIEDAAAMWIITAKEGNAVAQRELAILYLTHPEMLPRVTLPLTRPRDTFKAEMMYRRGKDPKFDPQSMCLALHWMQLSAAGGDILACNRLREREEFDSIA